MTPGKSLTPWVLLIEKESYLPSGPYLGRVTSGKRVGAQNEKRLNRNMQNYLKIGKQPLTLQKTKVKEITPVGNAYISYTQTFLKRNFCYKKGFLLVNLFTPSFNISHQEAEICGEKNSSQFHSINFEHSDMQIQAWLEPPNHLIHYRKSCVNHCTT